MEGINPIEILIYMISFIITFVLLYILLYKPVSKFLGARRERVANSLREAEATQKQAEEILNQSQIELANTGEKARKLAHEAIENAALDAEHIIDNAQDEAAEIIARANEHIVAARQAAMERAFNELVSLASDMASRILDREVSIDDNREIVERFFNENAVKDEGVQAKNGTENEDPKKEVEKA